MTYLATNVFLADGATTFWDFSFAGVSPDSGSGTLPYLYPADVRALEMYKDSEGNAASAERIVTIDPALPLRANIAGLPIAAGRQVKIYRSTEIRFPLVDYRDRQTVSEFDLDLANRQSIFVAQETQDAAQTALALDKNDNYDVKDHRIVNLAPGVDDGDAVNVRQLRRTVRVPSTEAVIPELPAAATRAGKVLTFDSAGSPQVVFPSNESALALAMRLASSAPGNGAEMVEFSPASGPAVTVGEAIRANTAESTAFRERLQSTAPGDGVALVGGARRFVLASQYGAVEGGENTAALTVAAIAADTLRAWLVMDIAVSWINGEQILPQRFDGQGCRFISGRVAIRRRKHALFRDFQCEALVAEAVWHTDGRNVDVSKFDVNGLAIPGSGRFTVTGGEANWGTFWNYFCNIRCSQQIRVSVHRQAVNQNQFVNILGNGPGHYGLLITDEGATTLGAFDGVTPLTITNAYQGVIVSGGEYSLKDDIAVPYTLSNWTTQAIDFLQRGIMEAHGNSFTGCDWSHSRGCSNEVLVRNQTNFLVGNYLEHGAKIYGNFSIQGCVMDGSALPALSAFNHMLNMADVSPATWGDSLSAHVANCCKGGDWTLRSAAGTPPGFGASFTPVISGFTGTPYGYTGIYGPALGTPVTGAFQYYDVKFTSTTGWFSAVIWLYAPDGQLPVSVSIVGPSLTESYRDTDVYNYGAGWYLLRVSGRATANAECAVRILATNGTVLSRNLYLGAAYVSSLKAAMFPMYVTSTPVATSAIGGIETKRGATGVGYGTASPRDIRVNYPEAFTVGGTVVPIPMFMPSATYLANYVSQVLIASDSAGFTLRITSSGTAEMAGTLFWHAEII